MADDARVAKLEAELAALRGDMLEHRQETAKRFDDIGGKLDGLLATFHRGQGVAWAAMSVGALLGMLWGFIMWVKDHVKF